MKSLSKNTRESKYRKREEKELKKLLKDWFNNTKINQKVKDIFKVQIQIIKIGIKKEK
jgi:hypothetical protein